MNFLVTIFVSLLIIVVSAGKKYDRNSAYNWPTTGPWIVTVKYGYNDAIIQESQRMHAAKFAAAEVTNRLIIKHTFADPDGLNAVVIEGITREELLRIEGVLHVHGDHPLFTSGATSWGLDRINVPNLPLSVSYNPDFAGCGVDIYIVDTGIDLNHIEMLTAGQQRTVTNIYNSFGYVIRALDDNGHGTHVAGIAGGNTIGVAKCANLYGLKVLDAYGQGLTSDIISALTFIKGQLAPKSRSIVNLSLGGPCGGNCADNPLNKMIATLATNNGIHFAIAANNDFGNDSCIFFPSSSPYGVKVAASDRYDNFANYSNAGSCVSIIAPGTSINSACARGSNSCYDEKSYLALSGTSQATPHVAGVMAQLLQKNPTATTTQVKQALTCDAVKGVIKNVARRNQTANLFLQIPKNNNVFISCQSTVVTATPTYSPTKTASTNNPPTYSPTKTTSAPPTGKSSPSKSPTAAPHSTAPSILPTAFPTTALPSACPSKKVPSAKPSNLPTFKPSFLPTAIKTTRPKK